MRFYAKLVVMIWLTMAIQRYALAGTNVAELWFGARCYYAHVTGNNRMLDGLVAEARERWQQDFHVNVRIDARVNASAG